ncbi:divergent polysaccharide deacetylase family protein [Thalassolituus sp. LLYu03]|uniref:divergent polysaccharide deacetylase family protein n=1 Tax=Thalassolituus sp. LLYu03 TaxID=3421656 RepID=UPI003D2C1C2A
MIRWSLLQPLTRLLFLLVICLPARAAELLLIIDDIGNNRTLGERAVALPAPVNLAFLPHTPHAAHLAEAAFARGHGIMLHAPMANEHGNRLGPGGLTMDMDQQRLQQVLLDDLQAVPHVQGMNNHMGSLLTQQPAAMQWVMDIARQQGLFFVDSLTSPASVALKQASSAGIPALERDVFLDNDTQEAALKKQYEHALSLARSRGYAVLIGHPYPQTLTFLAAQLPQLESRGVRLVSVEEHLRTRLWQRLAAPADLPSSRYLLNSSVPALRP